MRIALDARAFSWTGIGRYIRNLIQEFAVMPTEHDFTLLINAADEEKIKTLIHGSRKQMTIVPVESSYYSIREQTLFLWQLNQIKADLFHFTHFNIPLFFRRPYVVTIHDITRFIFPGQSDKGLVRQSIYEYVFKKSVEKARGLITVSNTTCEDLQQLPVRLPSVHHTIYEGVQHHFFKTALPPQRTAIRSLLKTDNPYLLFVGVWMEHKNIDRILEAFSLIKKRHPDLQLVITGSHKDKYVHAQERAIVWHVEKDVLFPGFIPEDLLPALYQEARVFVFPSLYEGFGLPALESAASGTPVITSNVSGVGEIMNGAAALVNPEYTPDIVKKMDRVLSDEQYRRQLIEAGKKRSQLFSWKSCAEKTVAIYTQSL